MTGIIYIISTIHWLAANHQSIAFDSTNKDHHKLLVHSWTHSLSTIFEKLIRVLSRCEQPNHCLIKCYFTILCFLTDLTCLIRNFWAKFLAFFVNWIGTTSGIGPNRTLCWISEHLEVTGFHYIFFISI